jgi:oxalate decarboxylase/phosphoglucose isomerase-like protein (cupin superfamily)
MKNSSLSQSPIEIALRKLAAAAQELSNVIEDHDHELSDAAPQYLQDADDFAYDITTFVEDEISSLSKNKLYLIKGEGKVG